MPFVESGQNHAEIKCKCGNSLMVKDLCRLRLQKKEDICRDIIINHLEDQLGLNETWDKCSECGWLRVISTTEKGVYICQNNLCRKQTCSVCRKTVLSNNELDFEQHKMCWNL